MGSVDKKILETKIRASKKTIKKYENNIELHNKFNDDFSERFREIDIHNIEFSKQIIKEEKEKISNYEKELVRMKVKRVFKKKLDKNY